jgi:curved DNA-binding protein CbpA
MNLYELLEISPNSSDNEIKKAWKKLALKYHPDKNNTMTSSEKFIKIKYAYDILSNSNLKKQYDDKLNHRINLTDVFDNFINSTETKKIIKLMYEKKGTISELFNLSSIMTISFDEFVKKLTNITITIDYDLKDVWLCNPKIIRYHRYSKGIFEELIYPVDFEQIYEDEGDEITINGILYKGDLIVKINIINTFCEGENYYIFDNELYVLVDNKKIKDNRFELNFLDGNKYKFNIAKLNRTNNKIGNVYLKKNFGFPKLSLNNITDKNIDIKDIESNITYSNLFFIFLL